MTTIDIHHIARIEGHGNVEIKLDGSKIENIELNTVEPARFFEAIVGGRHFNDLALIVSRICGICSPNHTMTGLIAVEEALGLQVSERTRLLRELLVHSSFIGNHATHLYFLASPDHLKLPSVFGIAKDQASILNRALELKRLGNDLAAAVGGRPVHPINAVVGGFTCEPNQMDLQVLAARLRAALKDGVETVELFAKFGVPDFHPGREMLSLKAPNDYPVLTTRSEVVVHALRSGWSKPVNKYHDYIVEHPRPELGNAKFSFVRDDAGGSGAEGEVRGAPFMVGALARINNSWDQLMPAAHSAAEAAGKLIGLERGADNPFLNNVCQAIEIVDALQRCAVICDKLAANYDKQRGQVAPPKSIDLRAGTGFAASEAPRGALYYSIGLDEKGTVNSGDVITPTAQNLACIEADLNLLAPQLEELPQDKMVAMVEQLIRAYDPCLSCAVH